MSHSRPGSRSWTTRNPRGTEYPYRSVQASAGSLQLPPELSRLSCSTPENLHSLLSFADQMEDGCRGDFLVRCAGSAVCQVVDPVVCRFVSFHGKPKRHPPLGRIVSHEPRNIFSFLIIVGFHPGPQPCAGIVPTSQRTPLHCNMYPTPLTMTFARL